MTNNLNSMTFIEVKNLSKTFDQFLANDSISMNIKKGEIHALLGENGAGKSTLVKCLYGVVKPSTGQILINFMTLKKCVLYILFFKEFSFYFLILK